MYGPPECFDLGRQFGWRRLVPKKHDRARKLAEVQGTAWPKEPAIVALGQSAGPSPCDKARMRVAPPRSASQEIGVGLAASIAEAVGRRTIGANLFEVTSAAECGPVLDRLELERGLD